MENQTMRLARKGKTNLLEAIDMLDKEIGGITAAICKPRNRVYRILNHDKIINLLPACGANSRELERLKELVALAYWKAQQNGSLRPGELHLGSAYSTKHHIPLLQEYIAGLLTKYQN